MAKRKNHKPEAVPACTPREIHEALTRNPFSPEQQEVLSLLRWGHSIKDAVDAIGYSRSAFNRWCDRNDLFRLAAATARDRYTDDLADAFHQSEGYARGLIDMTQRNEAAPLNLRVRCSLSLVRRDPSRKWLPPTLEAPDPLEPRFEDFFPRDLPYPQRNEDRSPEEYRETEQRRLAERKELEQPRTTASEQSPSLQRRGPAPASAKTNRLSPQPIPHAESASEQNPSLQRRGPAPASTKTDRLSLQPIPPEESLGTSDARPPKTHAATEQNPSLQRRGMASVATKTNRLSRQPTPHTGSATQQNPSLQPRGPAPAASKTNRHSRQPIPPEGSASEQSPSLQRRGPAPAATKTNRLSPQPIPPEGSLGTSEARPPKTHAASEQNPSLQRRGPAPASTKTDRLSLQPIPPEESLGTSEARPPKTHAATEQNPSLQRGGPAPVSTKTNRLSPQPIPNEGSASEQNPSLQRRGPAPAATKTNRLSPKPIPHEGSLGTSTARPPKTHAALRDARATQHAALKVPKEELLENTNCSNPDPESTPVQGSPTEHAATEHATATAPDAHNMRTSPSSTTESTSAQNTVKNAPKISEDTHTKSLDAVFLNHHAVHRHESAADFAKLHAEMIHAYQPATPREELTVLRIAQKHWALRRIDTFEMAISESVVTATRQRYPEANGQAAIALKFLGEQKSTELYFFERMRAFQKHHENSLEKLDNLYARIQHQRIATEENTRAAQPRYESPSPIQKLEAASQGRI